MSPHVRSLALRALTVVTAVALSGCSGGPAPSPTPKPSPAPSPSPSPGAAFKVDVIPAEEPVAVRTLIPGQHSSFLVVVTDSAPATGAVVISATAKGAKVITIIQPTAQQPVAEVWLEPNPSTTETTGSVTITATRAGATSSVERSFAVFPMEDQRGQDARPYFARWIAWLATAHPELGITKDTAWQPEFTSTLLVVSHYAYFSDEWELTLAWHVMVKPDDWSEIHLRRRGVDVAPSLAFRQDSVANATQPHPVAPPEVVVR